MDILTIFLIGSLGMAVIVIIMLHKYYSSKMIKTLDEWKKTELKEYENQIYKNIKLEYEAEYEEKFRKLEEKYQEKIEEWKQKELIEIQSQIKTSVENEYKAKYEEMLKNNLENSTKNMKTSLMNGNKKNYKN